MTAVELDQEGALGMNQLAHLAQALAQHHQYPRHFQTTRSGARAAPDKGQQDQQQGCRAGPQREAVGGVTGGGEIGHGLKRGAAEGFGRMVEVLLRPDDQCDQQAGGQHDAQESA